ncbi:MAG: hypothetical protein R2838_10790 [Caldilineaceae bacterium]
MRNTFGIMMLCSASFSIPFSLWILKGFFIDGVSPTLTGLVSGTPPHARDLPRH